jgi:hypothetical protein
MKLKVLDFKYIQYYINLGLKDLKMPKTNKLSISLIQIISVLVIGGCDVMSGSATKSQPKLTGSIVFGPSSDNTFHSFDGTPIISNANGVKLHSTVTSPSSGLTTEADHLIISPKLEEKVRGSKIKVTALAMTDPESPSSEFAIAYSTKMNGNSGWKAFTPTSSFEAYSIEYSVPSADGRAYNNDYIGIHADTTGSGNGVIVSSVSVEILSK